MKYTRAQRHEYYKKAFRKLSPHYGICWVLYWVVNERYPLIGYGDFVDQFPELLKRKPNNIEKNHYWFGPPSIKTHQIRKEVIKKCLEETSPKKKSKR